METKFMGLAKFWELVTEVANCWVLAMWAVGQGVIHMWCWLCCINLGEEGLMLFLFLNTGDQYWR